MQDMLLLQQKQTEFMQQEAIKKQKFMEFERIRNAMEQQTQPKPFGAMNEYAGTNLNNNMNNSNQVNSSRNVYVEQRKQDIGQQLEAMKSNVSNIKLKSQDMRDLAADKLYPQTGPNVKKRSDGISVDTSSSSSESSSTESSNSTSTSSSSSEVKAKSKSSNGKSSTGKSSIGSKKNQVEKSISSRNNQSSYSKRKYKRAGITIDT
jgi:hypothetical protein